MVPLSCLQKHISTQLKWHVDEYRTFIRLTEIHFMASEIISFIWFLIFEPWTLKKQPQSWILSRHLGSMSSSLEILVAVFGLQTSSPCQLHPYWMVLKPKTPLNSRHFECWNAFLDILVAIFELRLSSPYQIYPYWTVLERKPSLNSCHLEAYAAIMNFKTPYIHIVNIQPFSTLRCTRKAKQYFRAKML